MKRSAIFSILPLWGLLSSCASYRAEPLAVHHETIYEYEGLRGVSIGCKEFSREDCEIYLDRNVLKQGYQPIQLTFQNNSDRAYIFMSSQTGLPVVKPGEVAEKVHTSTVARILTYSAGAGAILFTPVVGPMLFAPLVVPAVVDGIMSFGANEALDKDFAEKSDDNFVILPKSSKTTILFVPKENVPSSFPLTLIDESSGGKRTVTVQVKN